MIQNRQSYGGSPETALKCYIIAARKDMNDQEVSEQLKQARQKSSDRSWQRRFSSGRDAGKLRGRPAMVLPHKMEAFIEAQLPT